MCANVPFIIIECPLFTKAVETTSVRAHGPYQHMFPAVSFFSYTYTRTLLLLSIRGRGLDAGGLILCKHVRSPVSTEHAHAHLHTLE